MSEPIYTSNEHLNSPFRGKGGVILAGAGPGDPELLTIKALRWLRQADVVIADRLVSDRILDEYANSKALILHAGKQAGKAGSSPQSVINELMVEYALQGKLVVRLKGGDPSLFSNVLDELQALTRHRIPYEIIPGVTAALGAAAYAGIPLTARGYSTAVRFLTWYKEDLWDAAYWKELAQTGDTLVFYMSSAPLDRLVENLIRSGIAEDKWLAVIEQATTPLQHVSTRPIHAYPGAKDGAGADGISAHDDISVHAGGERFVSPTLIIVGKVVALHEAFGWLPDNYSKESYFKPVGSHKIKNEERA
jgi:uroporphyrin-III C-methyltransferase